ncbi:alpha/beta fold hydrolase [Streptomyces sirii]|uniref:alpha/beta fold hydrolase n=1 Tax=Streptomyces sirii TaxID=3127701 RepID=UPI003D35E1F3
MNADTDRPTFLLVHGGWHGAWCWDPVRAALDADGWRSHAVDLPSANPRPAGPTAPGRWACWTTRMPSGTASGASTARWW